MSNLATSNTSGALACAALATPPVCPAQLGKYALRRELGRGGMGIVFEGEDTLLERSVAIKWLQPQGAQPLALDRLLREARWAARLNHPNTVAVYDAGEHESGVFIAMELVSGASAYEHVQKRGAFQWREATRIVAEVCQGLAAAHAAGLIHRDIKPANILLVEAAGPNAAAGSNVESLGYQPWAKLSDFGLSRSLDYTTPATVEGQVVGTPHYMSPEQIRGEQLDQRTDLYSLGATFYTLLTGRLPYERDDVIQVLFAHCSAAAPNPCETNPTLPEQCGRIIARCLAKEPRDRYSSAAALQADLMALLAGESPREEFDFTITQSAAEEVKPTPNTSPLKKRSAVALSGLGALIVAAFVLSIAIWNWSGQPTENAIVPSAESTAKAQITKPREWPALPPEGFTVEQPWTESQNGVIAANGEMKFMRLAPDGRTLAWGVTEGENSTGRLTLYDLDRQVVVGTHADDQQYASFSGVGFPNERYLIMSLSSRVIAIDRDTGETTTLVELNDGTARTIDLAPDGQRLLLGVVAWNGGGRVELYDLIFDPEGPRVEHRRLANREHDHPVKCVVASRDGKYVASASEDGVVIVGDSVSGQTLRRLSLPPPVLEVEELGYALEFSPDSKTLAAGGHRGVVLWDLATWERRVLPEKHERGIMALAFSSDGQFIASGTTDGVRIWNLAEGWLAGSTLNVHEGNVITGMTFARNDRVLITAGFDRRINFTNLGRLKRSAQTE